jgi:hypothetical protein
MKFDRPMGQPSVVLIREVHINCSGAVTIKCGNQTRSDWEAEGISYETHLVSASDLYERLEPRISAGTVAFVDVPRFRQQLLSVVSRNGKIQPRDGQSLDDHLNAAAGAAWLCRPPPTCHACAWTRSERLTARCLRRTRSRGRS